MDDRLARRVYEDNFLDRLTKAERDISLLQVLGIALQSYDIPVCSFTTKIGLVLSNNVSDANNDIDIAIGKIRDSTDTQNIILTTALTKRLDAAWAVGTNAGGLDTGSKANSTWYHVYVILDLTTGAVDVLFSTSVSAPTMPTGYTYKRRIGSIKTNGSGNIIAFTESFPGNFDWDAASIDLSNQSATIATLFTVLVPLGLKVMVIGRASSTTAGTWIAVFNPSITGTNCLSAYSSTGAVLSYMAAVSNTSSQLKYICSAANTGGYWYTTGWKELWQI